MNVRLLHQILCLLLYSSNSDEYVFIMVLF